ncbi:MAG: ABC transporter permease [Bacillota bacterium]|nr:MAG: glycine/betaine ABC transporter [Bacillota bacterium]
MAAFLSEFGSYLVSNADRLLELTVEHLQLSLAAVGFGLLVGIPGGVLMARFRRLVGPVLWVTNALQTVPALALAGFLMILFGLGRGTGIAVLFCYTLMPILRATYTGITSVDPALVEAARGMGMTRWQILRMVQLPLALSVLLVGVRVATVIAIGTATILSLIGAGGLGQEIFAGIRRVSDVRILAGAVPAALLAVLADAGISWLERRLTSPGLRVERSAAQS